MFENFTDRARRCIVLAQKEALDSGSSEIAPEHLLLGLLHEGESVAARLFREAGVNEDGLRGRVRSDEGATSSSYGPASTDVIERAGDESRKLGHEFVAPEHLALALLSVPGEGLGAFYSFARLDTAELFRRVWNSIADPSVVERQPRDQRDAQLGRRCPKCGASIEEFGKVKDLNLGVEHKDEPISLHAYFCGECGSTFGLVKR